MWILLGLIIGFCIILGYMISNMETPISALTLPASFLNILQFVEGNWMAILSVVLVIFGILIVIKYYQFDLNPHIAKVLQNVVSVETMSSHEEFSYMNSSKLLEGKCNNLSNTNCYLTKSCGMLNGSKCVAGNQTEPTFCTDNGLPIIIKTWHHEDPQLS